MSFRGRRPLVAGLALALSVGPVSAVANGAGPTTETNDGPTTARPPAPGSASSARAARIREQKLLNIPLTTHEGRSVRFYDDLVKGRVVALNFMFTTVRERLSAHDREPGAGPEGADRP